jgi:hypothetical protein
MAIDQINVSTPASQFLFTDTAMGTTVDGIKASSALLLYVFVDNSANAGAASYVQLYNRASGSVNVNVTAPDQVLYVVGGQKQTFLFYTGGNPGIAFNVALSATCVIAGNSSGEMPPVNPVIVTVAYV